LQRERMQFGKSLTPSQSSSPVQITGQALGSRAL
jgi:hypothetical protein